MWSTRLEEVARRWSLPPECQEALQAALQDALVEAARASSQHTLLDESLAGTLVTTNPPGPQTQPPVTLSGAQNPNKVQLTPPFTIPSRYEYRGLLGVGGMGEVHRIWDRALGREMVMKVIKGALVSDPLVARHFIEEAQITAQLDHPGVVPIHELGQLEDGRLYFTMREVRGQSLAALMERRGEGCTPTRTRDLIEQLHRACEAVAYAHARGVIHRDLKPDNIMVGGFGEVLVLDWGIARLSERAVEAPTSLSLTPHDRSTETSWGSVVGTPAYMPPEQARGELDKLGPACDVYALGATLYEILAGAPPYSGVSHMQILLKVVQGPPPPLMDGLAEAGCLYHLGDIPQELCEICERAMARAPEDRYPDAGALAEALHGWLQGTKARARALTFFAQARALREQVKEHWGQASRLQEAAEALLRALPTWAGPDCREDAWSLQDEARSQRAEALNKEGQIIQLLSSAIAHDAGFREAHEEIASLYVERHRYAERAGLDSDMCYQNLLEVHDQGSRYASYLRGDGALTLITDPPGAEATLYRYQEQGRRLTPVFARALGQTPLRAVPLPMGSYLVVLQAPGCAPVRYPVLIDRERHWDGVPPGESEPAPIHLPRAHELSEDDLYVPAGWTLSGDAAAWNSWTRRRIWVDSFVIRKHPVTLKEYLRFLNTLSTLGKLGEAELYAPRRIQSLSDDEVELVLERGADGLVRLGRPPRGPVACEDWPVMLVDQMSALAYAQWWAGRQQLPWTLPGEDQWEKAARGVDGRRYPWGDHLEYTWCNMSGSSPSHRAPLPIYSHPEDEGPYGLRGAGGNVRDWCRGEHLPEGETRDGHRAAPQEGPAQATAMASCRGGMYYGTASHVHLCSRFHVPPGVRSDGLGFRLARPWSPLGKK